MKIVYVSISYIPSRRANSIHVMKMCQAFAKLGHEVTLISKHTTAREESDILDDFSFYNVDPCFSIVKLARPKSSGGGAIFYQKTGSWLWQNRKQVDLVYGRDTVGSWLGTQMGLPGVVDFHDIPRTRLSRRITKSLGKSRNVSRFVFNCAALRNEFDAMELLSDHDNLVAHNGADIISRQLASPEVDAYLNKTFAPDQKHIAYVGNLYKGKGAEVVLALAHRIPDGFFHIIGGAESDLARWRQLDLPPNLIMHGFISHERLMQLYEAVDIFLMPSQREIYGPGGSDNDYGRWTSPIKLFEYMAAGKPIVCSDLPVLREVVAHEHTVLLVPPDNVDAWESAVRRLLADPDLCQKLGQAAEQDLLTQYTWDARARKVLDGL